MRNGNRARPYSIVDYEKIQSLRVRDRLQLMEDLWNSIFFGRGRNGGEVWFPLWDAIRHEFERRWPDEGEAGESRGLGRSRRR